MPPEKRLTVNKLGKGSHANAFRFSFRRRTPAALEGSRAYGLKLDLTRRHSSAARAGARRGSRARQMADPALHKPTLRLEAAQFYRCRRAVWSSSARRPKSNPPHRPALSDRPFPAAWDAPDDRSLRPLPG